MTALRAFPPIAHLVFVTAFAFTLLGCASQEILEPAGVRYLEVAASDYKLELQPVFDPAVTSYSALTDGPGIEVYVDVYVDHEVDAVLVNDVPAAISGYRTWRSVPETDLVAPVTAVVEVMDGSEAPAQYEISILVP